MKILIINTVLNTGSTGKIVTDMYKSLINLDHDVRIAYGRGEYNDSPEFYKLGSGTNVYLHLFEARFFDNNGFGSRRATKKFIRYIDSFNPDIIHIHNLHGYYINIKILFDYLKNFTGKIVWTLHDQWAFSSNSAYIYDNLTEKERKKEYPKTFFKFRDNYERKRKIFTSIDTDKQFITGPSKWIVDSASHSFFNKYNISVVHNGIDIDYLKNCEKINVRKKFNLGNKKIILGCASVWEKRKGIESFNELGKLIDEKDYAIVIIGKCDIKLQDNIIHIPSTNSVNEIASFFSEAYVFFNPTKFENFPTVNLESLACGCPVVTFGNGGSGEVVNKYVGRIIKNVSEFIQILEDVDFKNMKANCLNKSNEYSTERMIKNYLNIYSNNF